MNSYDQLVETEKRIYAGENPAASLPKIFTYWASRHLSPRLLRMFGTVEIEMFFALEIARVSRELEQNPVRILSLGSGECSLEVDVASRLSALGVPFYMTATDIAPGMVAAGREAINLRGLSDRIKIIECDINRKFPEGNFDVVLANHCLHHFIELEYIFDATYKAIGSGGAFIVSDMVGRNGHMRWPETLELVEAIWRVLPEQKRFDCMNRVQRGLDYINYNCADGTFEGIRAQDILPLLVKKFEFDRFLGYGGIPDIFLDRMYGHNFDANNQEDRAFVDLLELLNMKLTMSGQIKPTMMFATLRQAAANCLFDPIHPLGAVRLP